MFRNVVAALNEAQDITLFLKPMTGHFQVHKIIVEIDCCQIILMNEALQVNSIQVMTFVFRIWRIVIFRTLFLSYVL